MNTRHHPASVVASYCSIHISIRIITLFFNCIIHESSSITFRRRPKHFSFSKEQKAPKRRVSRDRLWLSPPTLTPKRRTSRQPPPHYRQADDDDESESESGRRDRGRRLERTEAGVDRESFPVSKASVVAKAARVFHRFPRVARRPFGSSVSFEVVARCDREVFRGFSFVFRHGAIHRRFVPPFELLDVARDYGGRGKIKPFRGVRVGGDEITERHERVVFHATVGRAITRTRRITCYEQHLGLSAKTAARSFITVRRRANTRRETRGSTRASLRRTTGWRCAM